MSRRSCVLVAAGCLAANCVELCAGPVQSYSLFKVARYQQSGTVAPEAPEAYAFGARYFKAPGPETGDVRLNVRGEVKAKLEASGPGSFDYVPSLLDSKSALDKAFPAENYTFAINDETAYLTLPALELYSPIIPAFTAAVWASLQRLDPAEPLTIEWNQFERHPLANAAFTFVRVYGDNLSRPVFAVSRLSPQENHCTIPAKTLGYGSRYRIELIFSNRADFPNAGFDGALGTIGFDNLTAAAVSTVAPPLDVVAQGRSLLISWPAAASGFVLEATKSLADPDAWEPIGGVTAGIGESFAVRMDAVAPQMYFRLRKQL